jgi:hypothetical protein
MAITRSTQQTTKKLLFGSWGIDEGSNKTRQDKRRLPQILVRLLRNGVQGSNKQNGSNSLLRSDRRSGRESNGDDEGEMGDTQKDPKHRNRRAHGQLLTQWKFPNSGLQFMVRVMNPIKGLTCECPRARGVWWFATSIMPRLLCTLLSMPFNSWNVDKGWVTCPSRQIFKWKGSSSQGSSPNQGPHSGLRYESKCLIEFDYWVDIVHDLSRVRILRKGLKRCS